MKIEFLGRFVVSVENIWTFVVGKLEVFFGLVFVLGDGPSFHSRLWICNDRFSPFISLRRLRRLFCLSTGLP
jgi:hypothetical protein